MSDIIPATLLALKDVDGVQGSFVLGGDGALVGMQMPALFDASMFVEVGPRIERLADSFAALGDELESCVVRFADHALCIKKFAKGGALCILASDSVNLPALRMAMNLADRRLTNAMKNGEPPAASALARDTRVPLPTPAVVLHQETSAAPPVQKSARYYRGRLVED